MERFFFTSEQVSKGHPDKVCDYIADSLLDAALEQDPDSRIHCDVLFKNNTVIIAGEIFSSASLRFEQIVRKALVELDCEDEQLNFHPTSANVILLLDQCAIENKIKNDEVEPSGEIKPATDNAVETLETVPGDHKTVSGYATIETPEMLPLAHVLATKLLTSLQQADKAKNWNNLKPNCKSQVTVEYERTEKGELIPIRVDTIMISIPQQDKNASLEELQKIIKETIIDKIVPENLVDSGTKYIINSPSVYPFLPPTAAISNPSGISGRRTGADLYGGWKVGNTDCYLSGKDGQAVERFGIYAARWIAKSLVSSGFCTRCLVSLSYTDGGQEPSYVSVDAFGTAKENLHNDELVKLVLKNFDLKPSSLVRQLGLKSPIFKTLSNGGHFTVREETLWEVPKKFGA